MKKSTKKLRRVAVIGSQGVPPSYGGFETLVDNIIRYRDREKVEYTVFCSTPDMHTRLSTYNGAKLRYVNLSSHGKTSVLYDIISMLRASRGYDSILVLGVSGCIFLPVIKLLTRTKIIVNIDGLEHLRAKWSKTAKRFLRLSLDICVRVADVVVSDNAGIKDYMRTTYGRQTHLIAYGGDHALRGIDIRRQQAILEFYGLAPGGYDLSICRIEPENNVELTLRAYENSHSGTVVAIIGNWGCSDYSRELYGRYSNHPRMRLLDAIYDLDILYAFRLNARRYIHGHRAGGTNPSLVEAMFFGKPILCFDAIYNRATTQGKAYYYDDAASLRRLVEHEHLSGESTETVAREQYIWAKIAREYEALY